MQKNDKSYYREFFTNNPAVMIIVDLDTRMLIDANLAACAFYGFGSDAIACRPFSELSAGDLESAFESMNQAWIGTRHNFPAKHRIAGGEVHDVEIQVARLDSEGKKAVYAVINDISESVENRRLIEEQFKHVEKQNEKLEAIIEHASNGVFIFDSNGKYITINRYAREHYLNYFSNIDYIGDAFLQMEHFDEEGRVVTREESPGFRVLNGERISDLLIRFRHGNGSKYLKVNGLPVFDEGGGFSFGILSIEDVSEQIRMNEMLKSQKDQLQAIIDNMSDGLAIYSKSGKIIMYNEASLDYLSFAKETVKDFDFRENYICRDMFGKILSRDEMPLARALQGEKIVQKRLLFESDAEKVYLDVSATPVYNRSKISMIILNVRNVTQNVLYNELLLNQQKIMLEAERKEKYILEEAMEIKDNFVMMITHEFKTPISIINAAIQTMELVCGDELSAKAQGYLNKIKQNSLRQLRLVDNLLHVSSIQAGYQKLSEQTVDIVALTRAIIDSVQVYALRKNIELIFDPMSESDFVSIDDEKYERILLNLLSNAIKFTPPEKNVTVALTCGEESFQLEVRDQGIGIPKGKQRLIFQRFGQVDSTLSRQAEGTGLGLYLVKSMVASLEGSIELKSSVGHGAVFTVVIPSHKARIDKSGLKRDELLETRIEEAASVEFSDIYLKNSIKSTNSKNK